MEECQCFAHLLLLGYLHHICNDFAPLPITDIVKENGKMNAMLNEGIKGAWSLVEETYEMEGKKKEF